MHEFDARKQMHEAIARLRRLHDDLHEVTELVATAHAAMDERVSHHRLSLEEAVADVEGMLNEQRRQIDDARQRGHGPGLYRVLDAASDLDSQQTELLKQARCKPEVEAAKEALRRYAELERQQLAILSEELGKFEAQGLAALFARYRELAEQQQKILGEVLGAPRVGG